MAITEMDDDDDGFQEKLLQTNAEEATIKKRRNKKKKEQTVLVAEDKVMKEDQPRKKAKRNGRNKKKIDEEQGMPIQSEGSIKQFPGKKAKSRKRKEVDDEQAKKTKKNRVASNDDIFSECCVDLPLSDVKENTRAKENGNDDTILGKTAEDNAPSRSKLKAETDVAKHTETTCFSAQGSEAQYDLKKVYVGGMPYYSTEEDIHNYFAECGTITELDCMTFPDTGKFRGIAFITFKTETAAKRALALDGADMGGRFLKIQKCRLKPPEGREQKPHFDDPPSKAEGCTSAYIGNLSWNIQEENLRSFFKGCQIVQIRLALDKATGEFRGFGHVDFLDDKSLEKAMKLNQKELLGRAIKIAYSVPKKKN